MVELKVVESTEVVVGACPVEDGWDPDSVEARVDVPAIVLESMAGSVVVEPCSVVEAGAPVELSGALTEDTAVELDSSVVEAVSAVVLLAAPLVTEEVLDCVADEISTVVDCPTVDIIEPPIIDKPSVLSILLSVDSIDGVVSRLDRLVCCC